MIFRIDNYLEKWAQIYKPISHDPTRGSRDKRFYRIDSIFKLESFAANISLAKSPSMLVVTQMDGELDGQSSKFIRYTHRVFFMVKQVSASGLSGVIDEVGAADAKAEGQLLGQDLLAWLMHDYKENKNKELAGLDFSTATIFSVPEKFNDWWGTEVTIEHLVPRNLCVSNEKYDLSKVL